jgi:hypothetical protein
MEKEMEMKPMIHAIRAGWSDPGLMRSHYDFQPGNGTRYLVMFSVVPPSRDLPEAEQALNGKAVDRLAEAEGLTNGGWVLSWTNAGRCMVIARHDGVLVAEHVQNRLKCSRADALQLLRLIEHATGRKVETGVSSEYEG